MPWESELTINYDTNCQDGNDNRTDIEPRPRQTGEDNHGEEADPWNGPFTEYNKYDRPTGHAYVRCGDCGIEVVTSQREHATHRPGCEHADSENGQLTDAVGEHVTGSDR